MPTNRRRWYNVVRRDGTEVLVQATSHTAAKVKGANWFVYAAAKRWPDVQSCRLVKGMNG